MELVRINQLLEQLPALKARSAEQAEDAKLEYERLNARFDLEHARFSMTFRVRYPDDTVAERKARVESEHSIIDLKNERIIAEAKWRRLLVQMNSFDDQFTAVKMLARIKIAEIGGRLSVD